MSNTALTNKVALASTGDKLKHWTQAIRDLYAEFLELKGGVVPKWHASPTKQYGEGSTFRFGHLKLLDKMLYEFRKNDDGTYWTRSNIGIRNGYKWNAVTFHSGLFVAVGSHGRIVTSVDGKEWDDVHWSTTSAANSNYEFFDVAWCGNIFVAVGSYNSFVYSYDGTYWHAPMFVGSSYNEANVLVPHSEDLSVCPSGFKSTDAWKGVAYDDRSGVIMLCGTQCRTMACRYTTTSTVATVVFEEPVFHIEDPATAKTHELRSVAVKKLDNAASFVACGNWNEVVQITVEWGSMQIHGQIVDGVERIAPMTIEDNVHTIARSTINADTGWNSAVVRFGPDGIERFVLLGTSGQSVMSLTGIADSWNVPLYEDTTIQTNFTCQATGGNLTVAAGEWTSNMSPNITMYNDSVYTESEDQNYGSSVSTIQHFTDYVDNASWYGAAYGKMVFVLAGDNNRLYWSEIAEQDYSGAALSVEFYKRYIAELEERVNELENSMTRNDMSFILLRDTTRIFNWSDKNAQMYKTSGDVVLSFNPAPQSIYKEMMIYLEAYDETHLSLGGVAEWENDLIEPEWGKMGSHLAMKAIFIGSRVIIQIIDNDQLADNLVDLMGG